MLRSVRLFRSLRFATCAASLALAAAPVMQPADAQPARGTVAAGGCAMAASDQAWLARALDGWAWTSRALLRLDARPLPWIVVFDERCAWHLAADPSDSLLARARPADDLRLSHAGAPVRALAVPHEGEVPLPNGARVPARIVAFAAPHPDGERAFLAIALPSVWRRSERIAASGDVDALVLGVFMHEAAHTAQVLAADRTIARVGERMPLPDDLDDDVVQRRFGERPGYREAYERERDLLFRAALESDSAHRVALAREAVAAMRERRARHFTGADAGYAALEDLFLTMEGVGNWTALGYMRAPEGLALAPDEALTRIRGSRRSWTQEQGLALFLLLDALVPDWQRRVLGPEGATGFGLLEEAVR